MNIQGLLTQKPGNEPTVGQVKNFNVENRVAASGKAWTKIRNPSQDNAGTPYKVISVKPTGFTDQHGNVSFNIEIEPANGAQSPQNAPQSVGRDDARHYAMRAANLLQMAHNAACAVLGKDYTGEDARTLFIQMAREGYVKEMPDKPVPTPEQAKVIFNAEEAPPPDGQDHRDQEQTQDEF